MWLPSLWRGVADRPAQFYATFAIRAADVLIALELLDGGLEQV